MAIDIGHTLSTSTEPDSSGDAAPVMPGRVVAWSPAAALVVGLLVALTSGACNGSVNRRIRRSRPVRPHPMKANLVQSRASV